MSSPVATIELHEDHAVVIRGSARKRVAMRDAVQAITTSAAATLQYARTETVRLPRNAYLTVYAGDRLNICCYYPQREATVGHFSRKYKIMLPNIVIHYVLKISDNGLKHEVVGTFYYCTDKSVDDLPSVIPGRLAGVFGHMPFPNFYDDFRMCFGGNTLMHRTEGGDLRMLNMFYDVIENSPFNDDLRLNGVRLTSNKQEWFEYLASYYKEHKAFPYNQITV